MLSAVQRFSVLSNSTESAVQLKDLTEVESEILIEILICELAMESSAKVTKV